MLTETAARQLRDVSSETEVFRIVAGELARLRTEQFGDAPVAIRPDSSLLSDLGFDSISMVEAVVAIEAALDIGEFPLGDWSDRESDRADGDRFTVRSLVAACLALPVQRASTPEARP